MDLLTQPTGVFNSSDVVAVLAAGKYDDGIPNNATYDEGDWNQDDDFDSGDFTFALAAGNYSSGVDAAANDLAAAIDVVIGEEGRRGARSWREAPSPSANRNSQTAKRLRAQRMLRPTRWSFLATRLANKLTTANFAPGCWQYEIRSRFLLPTQEAVKCETRPTKTCRRESSHLLRAPRLSAPLVFQRFCVVSSPALTLPPIRIDGMSSAGPYFNEWDLVDAFVDGGYNQGPRASLAAVPEPSAHLLLLVASWGLAYFARR